MSCKGKVKSFNPGRGFGFITDKEGDTFFLEKHCEDGKQPKKGDIVLFDKVPGQGKSCKFEARNVTGGSGEPIKASAETQSVPAEHPEQQGEIAKEAPLTAGGYASSSGAPVAETAAACNPSESCPQGGAEHVDIVIEASADAKKTACAGKFDSMHDAYQEFGAEDYYRIHGSSYMNPHEPVMSRALVTALNRWTPKLKLPLRRVHDLACGSGEASAAFSKIHDFAGCALDASDPYTFAAFEKRMGRPAYRWSFEDIAGGVLEDLQPYDLVIGSFSLHLLTKEWQHTALSALARSCHMLVVLTPHKQPVIEPSTGWRQMDEVVYERIRVRLFVSDGARRLAQGEPVEHSEHTIICEPAPSREEEMADEDELATKELAEISEAISNMNQHELREALIRRGLSTAGKRSQWADRLFTAVKEAKEPKGGSESFEDRREAEKSEEEDLSHGEGEGESESEESSDEEYETEEDDESVPSQSTRDDEDEATAALAARKAAVKKALLAAKKTGRRTGNRTIPIERAGDVAEAKKDNLAKPKKEVNFVVEKTKDARMQGNFGLTKFIKP
jgi:cold shock CspA family protein/SAM-dependent methyltransferase